MQSIILYLKQLSWLWFFENSGCMQSTDALFEYSTFEQERLRDKLMRSCIWRYLLKKDFMSEVGIEPWTPVWETSALPTELPGIHVKPTLKRVIQNYRRSTKAVKGWNEREVLTTDEQSVPLALCASPMGLLRGPIKDWQQLLWFHGLL